MGANGGLVSAINYNHDLVKIKTPVYALNKHGRFDECWSCSKCKIVICYSHYSSVTDHFFFINGIEIFEEALNLFKLNLTCEEIQIKLLLE